MFRYIIHADQTSSFEYNCSLLLLFIWTIVALCLKISNLTKTSLFNWSYINLCIPWFIYAISNQQWKFITKFKLILLINIRIPFIGKHFIHNKSNQTEFREIQFDQINRNKHRINSSSDKFTKRPSNFRISPHTKRPKIYKKHRHPTLGSWKESVDR